MAKKSNSSMTRLSARKRQIVEHVGRDRLTTNKILRKRFFAECHTTTVTRTTADLCSGDWLNSYSLLYPLKYYCLGKRAASALGMLPSATLSLGTQALPTEYAILLYTANNHPDVQRLSNDELRKLHRWFQPEWFKATHALRTGTITELLRVDLGGPADHITRKCLSEIHARYAKKEFRRLLANQEFQLVVITGATEKAAQINSALTSHAWPQGMRFRIAVFTELLSLLPRSY